VPFKGGVTPGAATIIRKPLNTLRRPGTTSRSNLWTGAENLAASHGSTRRQISKAALAAAQNCHGTQKQSHRGLSQPLSAPFAVSREKRRQRNQGRQNLY
jgi:hypothetical protein